MDGLSPVQLPGSARTALSECFGEGRRLAMSGFSQNRENPPSHMRLQPRLGKIISSAGLLLCRKTNPQSTIQKTANLPQSLIQPITREIPQHSIADKLPLT